MNAVNTLNTMRNSFAIFLFLILLAGLALVCLGYGQVQISPANVWAALIGTSQDPTIDQIISDIRGPRILTAIIAGAALGVGGVLMQALFRNPMTDAWSLGLVAGGQMGVALLVTGAAFSGPAALIFLTQFQGLSTTFGAALGVGISALAMGALAKKVGSITLLVVGLMLGFTAQGLVSVVLHFANRAGGRVYSGWNDGTFSSVMVGDLPILLLPVVAGVVIALLNAKGLTALLLGETYAKSLGTDVTRLRRMVLAATVLLVAPITAFCGPVTFVGLIVPHFARAIAGTARILPLLPLAALTGALLALSAEFVVHLPWEQHFLHLNAVLAIVGAPVVILLLIFSRSMRGQN